MTMIKITSRESDQEHDRADLVLILLLLFLVILFVIMALPQDLWVVGDVECGPGGGTSGPRFLPRTLSSFPLLCCSVTEL